jgi:hypothetical protein
MPVISLKHRAFVFSCMTILLIQAGSITGHIPRLAAIRTASAARSCFELLISVKDAWHKPKLDIGISDVAI